MPLKKLILSALFSIALSYSFVARAQDASAQAQDTPDVDPLALTGDAPPVSPDTSGDKEQYDLFNPVPDDAMRPFSTDRPGKTHSALTVDAGHFQLESDFFNYTYGTDETFPQIFKVALTISN